MVRSERTQTRSSCGVTGKGNGAKAACASASVSKQRSGVLPMMPRGSKPTRSKRARTSSEPRERPTRRRRSTPDSPGPPAPKISEPILRLGSPAGRRLSASEIVGPPGWS